MARFDDRVFTATVTCLMCFATFETNGHSCNKGCRMIGHSPRHEGACPKCRRRMLRSFSSQIERLQITELKQEFDHDDAEADG